MSKFMDWLNQELVKMQEDEVRVPDEPIRRHEKVVGTLESLDIKKIFELKRRAREAVMSSRTLSGGGNNHLIELLYRQECSDLRRAREIMLNFKIRCLEDLFWTCVRHEVPEQVVIEAESWSGFGIRQGWQVVLVQIQIISS